MSRYQQTAMDDGGYGGGYGGHGQGGGGGGHGGYMDNPQGGGGYGSGGGGGAGAGYGNSNEYPMSSSNPYASNSSNPRGYNTAPKKSRKKLWWIIAAIVAVCVIVAAVVGGVVGSRKSSSGASSSSDNNKGTSGTASGGEHGTAFPTGTVGASTGNTALPTMLSFIGTNLAAQTQTGVNGEVYLAVATDVYMLPAYATGTYTDNLPAPTKDASPGTNGAWPTDPSPPSTSAIRDHPRLIAPQYKWDALTGGMIAADPYLSYWNATIIANASDTLSLAPTAYIEDGGLTGSGVLDVAREIKMRVKNWAYAYRITKDTKYADRVWLELRTAAGNNSDVPFGTDASRWNGAGHFLDLAEFCNAFAIGYDWLHDVWTTEQLTQLREWITSFGLQYGLNAYQNLNGGGAYNWWSGQTPGVGGSEVNGNWNCVCNGGLLLASLAIAGEDTTGMAETLISLTQGSLKTNCFNGAHSDGTWAETANYWYFGTSAAGEIVSSLISAYGDDGGLSTANPGWNLTSLYHMYVQGMTSLFNYGDHGPNKFGTTANSLLLWANVFNEPRYALYQRDHYDAAEPWSMFYYDPTVEGAWWNGLPLDRHFDDNKGEWATARSSWSDNSGTYWAIKAGNLTGHQTHGDLDHGDFVFDAMGQRWAGDLGSGQYLADGYFSNETQQSERWDYYRKRTDGQNTMLINYENQLVSGLPSTNWQSTGTAQGAAPYLSLDKTDTAFFTMDMSTSYSSGSVKRGIRFLNGRRQMLLQDEVTGATSGQDIQWRMHTNATVSTNGASATLTLEGKTLKVDILNANPSGLTFTTMDPVRLSQDGSLPSGSQYNVDMPNDGTTVLVIENSSGGSFTTQVLFTPQWPDMQSSDYVTNPTNVALDQWSLTSHN